MTLSIAELARAREAVAGLLEELRLDPYLFEVEPRDEHWELKVDCALETEGAGESITPPLSKEPLLRCTDDASVRQQLFAQWRERLRGKRAITADTAVRLAEYFGTSEKFWMGLQADYDLEEVHRRRVA